MLSFASSRPFLAPTAWRGSALALLLGLGLSTAALAQPSHWMSPAANPVAGESGRAPAHRAHSGGAARLDRLADLKTSLVLDAPQDAAWAAWVSALSGQRDTVRNAMVQFRQQAPQLTTPERVARMQAISQMRLSHTAAVQSATLQFYAQLRPDQQQRFDQASLELMQGMGSQARRRHERAPA